MKAKKERWGTESESGTSKALEALDRVVESLKGRELKLQLAVGPDRSDPVPGDAIDVTGRSDSGE